MLNPSTMHGPWLIYECKRKVYVTSCLYSLSLFANPV